MIYEFAATPQVFGHSAMSAGPGNHQALLAFMQGLSFNGLLADLNSGQWRDHAARELASCPWPNRRDLIAVFNRLESRGRLVFRSAVGRNPRNEADWAQEITASHDTLPFHAVVLSSSAVLGLAANPPYPSSELAQLLSSSFWSARLHTVRAPRTGRGFQNALAPVLRHALRVSFVDPRILYCPLQARIPTSRIVGGVQAALRAAADRRHTALRMLEFHGAANHTSLRNAATHPWDSVASVFKAAAIQVGLNPQQVLAYIWEEKPGGQQFHNRAIVTNYCAVEVPNGLDLAMSPGSTDRLTLLDSAEHDRLQQDLGKNSPTFTLVRGFPRAL